MIHLLDGSALEGELPSPSKKGINPLFKARLNVEGESRRCYVKPQPDYVIVNGIKCDNREIVNETVGYVLARACGFQTPEAAGVTLLNRQQIPSSVLAHADDITAGPPQETFLCWFSEDMGFSDLVVKHTTGIASQDLKERLFTRISRDLRKRDELPALVSFDEWTLNRDRHPGNVLGSGPSQVALIDHGQIFLSPFWQPRILPLLSRIIENNQMIAWAELTDPGWARKLPIKSQREIAYTRFNDAFHSTGQATVRDALSSLALPGDQINGILDCLGQRLEPDHYRRAIGLIA